MFGFIYITTNHINGKRYIGQRKYHFDNPRSDELYLGSGVLLKAALKKYGRASFSKEIVEECSSQAELNDCERKWVEKYDAVNSKDFYNIAQGGMAGDTWSGRSRNKKLKFRKRISDSNRNRTRDTSKICGKNNPAFGRHWYKDMRTRKQYYLFENDPLIVELGLVKGLFRSKKHNSKISKAHVGKKKNYTVYVKGKISVSKDGRVKFIDPSDLSKYESKGYVKGNCRTKVQHSIFMNDGNVNKLVNKKQVKHYESLGWHIGKLVQKQYNSLKGR